MIDAASLPASWEVVALRRLLRKLERGAGPADEVITAYRDGEVTLRSVRREEGYTLSDTESGYQRVEPGDLVFHALDGFAGAVGVSKARGKCTPVYHVCDAPLGDDLRFIAYSLRAMGSSGFLALQAGNVRQRSVDFRTWDAFARIPLARPPLSVQVQIADLLDVETELINALIEKKRQLVAALLRRRYAAVSSHISSRATSAWRRSRLKYVASVNLRTLPEDQDPEFEFRYVDIGAVGRGRLTREPEEMQFAEAPSRARRIVCAGDTLISTVRTYLRCVWTLRDEADLPTIASTGFAVITPGAHIDPQFLGRWAESDACIDRVVAESVGVSYPAISPEDLGNLPILLPPLSEQRAIARDLGREVDAIEAAIRGIEGQVFRLEERRQALIAASVTGQLDVAKTAA